LGANTNLKRALAPLVVSKNGGGAIDWGAGLAPTRALTHVLRSISEGAPERIGKGG